MLTINLPPAVVPINMRCFLDAFGRYVATGEIVDVDRQRESQDDAEHGPLPCVEASCEREECVFYRTRTLAAFPNGLTRCAVCHQTVSNDVRLACESCAC